ncbi:penicillin-binding protein H [Brevibacillus laterosporus LMG 15441]|uniref:Penicillin-binding protein H n=2 Tax=Brevibacillus laterosporus TaxID=1465 RepID=A0A075RD89_BRELA|nr:penicillin-binding protein H [Brevibacillus laterosporus LMG 15441]
MFWYIYKKGIYDKGCGEIMQIEPEQQRKKDPEIVFRVNIMFLAVFICFVVVILRLAYVQVVQGELFAQELEKYSLKELPIPAPRGHILDRNGVVLVDNKPVFTVKFMDRPEEKINKESVAEELATLLDWKQEERGDDKKLADLGIQLQASFPIILSFEQRQRLRTQIQTKLDALPSLEKMELLQSVELLRLAKEVHIPIKYAFTDVERTKALELLRKKTGKTLSYEQGANDRVLLGELLQQQIPFPYHLEKKQSDDLVRKIKSSIEILRATPVTKQSDRKLIENARFFFLDVNLGLSGIQREQTWRKLLVLERMVGMGVPAFMPRQIKRNITAAEDARIEERLARFPGVYVEVEPLRKVKTDANGGPLATHILGYINSIDPRFVKEYKSKQYSGNELVGVAGLENYYESQLRGKTGAMTVQVNRNSEFVNETIKRVAEPGNDLILTLDWRFQDKVEEILHKNLSQKNLKVGHAVVMSPDTGEILALANYPDYDLNLYYDRETFSKVYKTDIWPYEDNKITRGAYAPGSTVKPISVMLALQEGLVTPSETIIDRGGLLVGNRFKNNWLRSGHGAVDARRALQVSNNTYMYEMGLRLARKGNREGKHYSEQFNVLDYYNSQFGLGVKTGIDLPGEKAGYLANDKYLGNLVDAFIGQYNSFTPMQLCQYVSTIANGGYRIKPHLVKEIRKGASNPTERITLTKVEPYVLNKVDIDPKWIKVVQEGMAKVTQPNGTAYRNFKGFPFPVAAKTGTAQTGGNADNALIVGYAPVKNPQIAFAVVVPGGGHGADMSGVIAKQILEEYVKMYGIEQ